MTSGIEEARRLLLSGDLAGARRACEPCLAAPADKSRPGRRASDPGRVLSSRRQPPGHDRARGNRRGRDAGRRAGALCARGMRRRDRRQGARHLGAPPGDRMQSRNGPGAPLSRRAAARDGTDAGGDRDPAARAGAGRSERGSVEQPRHRIAPLEPPRRCRGRVSSRPGAQARLSPRRVQSRRASARSGSVRPGGSDVAGDRGTRVPSRRCSVLR